MRRVKSSYERKVAMSVSVLAVLIGFGGCAVEEPAAGRARGALEQGLIIDVADEQSFVGSFQSADGLVVFQAHTDQATRVDAALDVNGQIIEIWFDGTASEQGVVGLRVPGAAIDAPRRAALLGLARNLEATYPAWGGDVAATPSAAVTLYSSFLADADAFPQDEYIINLDDVPAGIKDTDFTPPGDGEGGGSGPSGCPACIGSATCNTFPDDDGVAYLSDACCANDGMGQILPWRHDAQKHCELTMHDWCGYGATNPHLLPLSLALAPTDGNSTACAGACGSGCATNEDFFTQDCLDRDLCLAHAAISTVAHTGYQGCMDELNDTVDDWAKLFSKAIPFLGDINPIPRCFHL